MSKLIIVRGERDSGKTTTLGLLYSELLKISNSKHLFDDNDVDKNSLRRYDNNEKIHDFTAVLTINEKKIGLISHGDIANDLRIRLNIFIEIECDIIICCARSRNVKGSSYRMISDEFKNNNPIIKEVWTKYSQDKKDKESIKKEVVEELKELVLNNL